MTSKIGHLIACTRQMLNDREIAIHVEDVAQAKLDVRDAERELRALLVIRRDLRKENRELKRELQKARDRDEAAS